MENPSTQINTFNGTVSITFQLNTVDTILWHIGPEWFAQVNQHLNKRRTTLGRHYLDVVMALNILHNNNNHRFNTNQDQRADNQQHNNNCKTKNIFLVVAYTRDFMKVSRKHAADMNRFGYVGLYIVMRHSVVVLLLPWFCKEHKTGIPFVHCYFILYKSVTLCVVVVL